MDSIDFFCGLYLILDVRFIHSHHYCHIFASHSFHDLDVVKQVTVHHVVDADDPVADIQYLNLRVAVVTDYHILLVPDLFELAGISRLLIEHSVQRGLLRTGLRRQSLLFERIRGKNLIILTLVSGANLIGVGRVRCHLHCHGL